MKILVTRLIICFALILLLVANFAGCKKKDDPKPKRELVTIALKSNLWKVQSVQIDGADRTSMWTGFTLKFEDETYSTTNGNVVWPAQGTWSFTDDTATTIRRSDGVDVVILETTPTSLKLQFSWATTTLGGGRVESVRGVHTFNLVP